MESSIKVCHKLTIFQKIYIKIKGILAIVISALGLAILWPVCLGIIIAIKVEDGILAPVVFAQERIGLQKSHFYMYKFRTMKVDAPRDVATHLMENPELYITKVGKFLRKTSLDELPQLINIVKGDMYIIGSRPALYNQYDLIEARESCGVHQVKPGLTGWAQIHGRDELEISEKVLLDAYYVQHLGPIIDMKCFFGTIMPVLRGDGVVEGGTGKNK